MKTDFSSKTDSGEKTMEHHLTLTEVITLDPRIREILAVAKCIPHPSYEHYQKLKSELNRFVGFSAEKPELRSTTAYEVVDKALLSTMKL